MPPRKHNESTDVIYKESGNRNRPGKNIECPSCGAVRWISLDNISRSPVCKNCRRHPPRSSVNKKCVVCGNDFRVRKSVAHKYNCCSLKCRKTLFLSPRKCSRCGKEFKPTNSKKKYCSRKCFYLDMYSRITKKCETCGKSFDVIKSQPRAKFCSKKCQMSRPITDRPNFKHGKFSNKSHPYPYGGKWPSIRKWILDRDNHICQYEGCQSSDKLQVHHKKKFDDSFDKDQQNNPENLITLCLKHHQEMHRKR